ACARVVRLGRYALGNTTVAKLCEGWEPVYIAMAREIRARKDGDYNVGILSH
ncbi:hypothetical protein GBAR_LOCUS31721, partial [Geodia barretti]